MMYDENHKKSTRSTMSVPKDSEMKYVCCVCNKQRDRRGNRKICVLEKGDRSESLWKKASELQDEKMLLKVAFGDTVGDLVSRDVRYHEP